MRSRKRQQQCEKEWLERNDHVRVKRRRGRMMKMKRKECAVAMVTVC